MKKTKSLLIATMVIAAITTTFFVGCKKEKDDAKTQFEKTEAQILQSRIEAFQTLRESVNAGAKVDGTMTVDEMREILCLVSNYEYSEHETYCLKTTIDTLQVPMPTVDMNGNVSEPDVVAVYSAFETALQDRMESLEDDMDVPSLFSIVLPTTGAKASENINIVFKRGLETEYDSLSPTIGGPFDGICYHWGLQLGPCNGGLGIYNSDAALEMTKQFMFIYPTVPGTTYFENVEYVDYVGTNAFEPYNFNWVYWEPDDYITPCDQWLFFKLGPLNSGETEPCLCEDELNCEYFYINNCFKEETGEMYYSPNLHSPFFECIVEAVHVEKPSDLGRLHVAHMVYANYRFNPDQD